ncbi:hypothetical protein [Ligilactobacillus equi]|nr:hypothetical protein [Ligilactobacillus equi]
MTEEYWDGVIIPEEQVDIDIVKAKISEFQRAVDKYNATPIKQRDWRTLPEDYTPIWVEDTFELTVAVIEEFVRDYEVGADMIDAEDWYSELDLPVPDDLATVNVKVCIAVNDNGDWYTYTPREFTRYFLM